MTGLVLHSKTFHSLLSVYKYTDNVMAEDTGLTRPEIIHEKGEDTLFQNDESLDTQMNAWLTEMQSGGNVVQIVQVLQHSTHSSEVNFLVTMTLFYNLVPKST